VEVEVEVEVEMEVEVKMEMKMEKEDRAKDHADMVVQESARDVLPRRPTNPRRQRRIAVINEPILYNLSFKVHTP